MTIGRQATIEDVSRLAGCSKGVVSAVVNKAKGNIAVSEATRQRVLDAAKQLGYRPNFASRCLIRRSTHTIGIYVPPESYASIGYSYEARILRGVERACREHSYDMLALNLGGSVDPVQCAGRLAEGRVDGLLLLHVQHYADWLESLLQKTHSVVAVNYYGPVKALTTINFNDRAASALAVKHLASLGHRRIGYVSAATHDLGPGQILRHQGFMDAMAEQNLSVDPRWIWDLSSEAAKKNPLDIEQEGIAGADYMLTLDPGVRPTALVFYDDAMAALALQRLAERGVRVPQEMSVIGIDDSEVAALLYPKLSSVRQPLEDMGYRAATLLIGRASRSKRDDKGSAPVVSTDGNRELCAPTMVPRQSSGAAPATAH